MGEFRKTERVPIMFDRELLKKVDDYGFRMQMRSRGGVVRFLLEKALEIENKKADATAS